MLDVAPNDVLGLAVLRSDVSEAGIFLRGRHRRADQVVHAGDTLSGAPVTDEARPALRAVVERQESSARGIGQDDLLSHVFLES